MKKVMKKKKKMPKRPKPKRRVSEKKDWVRTALDNAFGQGGWNRHLG
ncbi:MAG: hypothetical protein Q8Q92_03075 [bacterium]|nr:hypothetical protein [bacterium]